MGGHPCIRGMRITVRRVHEIPATYPERQELFEDFPDLEEEDLQQALAFAAATVDGTIGLTLTRHEEFASGPGCLSARCWNSSGKGMGCDTKRT